MRHLVSNSLVISWQGKSVNNLDVRDKYRHDLGVLGSW